MIAQLALLADDRLPRSLGKLLIAQIELKADNLNHKSLVNKRNLLFRSNRIQSSYS
jgi:hypothetical protein